MRTLQQHLPCAPGHRLRTISGKSDGGHAEKRNIQATVFVGNDAVALNALPELDLGLIDCRLGRT
jgi:hypothetical protein